MGNMKPKYTYKSGGKLSKKIDLAGHSFHQDLKLTIICDRI